MRFVLLFMLLPQSAVVLAQEEPSLQDRVRQLEDRLGKIEGAPAPVRNNSFNPSIGMAIDALARDFGNHANFGLRAAELNLEAPIDPFLKGWAVITASNGGINLEEAAMQTTALPAGLQLTGGRFFAPFGRLSQWHDHELPMVDRPNSLNAYVGGEAQADGVQVRYLMPTPFFFEAMAVSSNKLGTDNNRTDNQTVQPFDRWTHLGRLHAYTELSDDISADWGASLAWTPKSNVCPVGATPYGFCDTADSWRTLSGLDVTFRYQPSAGGLYKGVVWGTEVLQNNERGFNPFTQVPIGRQHSYAGYTNAESKVGRNTRVGGFVDATALPDASRYVSHTCALYASYEFSEFNRLRFEFARVRNNYGGALGALPGTDFGLNDLREFTAGHYLIVQWTTVLGYHVHGFRGRWGT